MSKYFNFLTEDRRLCLLRLLTDVNGTANESVLQTGLEALGHVRIAREEVCKDIRFLIDNGCVTNEWCGQVQVITITRRGVEAAQGRLVIEGIKKPSIGV